MKKITAVTLTIILALALFSGCKTSTAKTSLEDLKLSGVYALASEIWLKAAAEKNSEPLSYGLDGSEKNVVIFSKINGVKADGSEDISALLTAEIEKLSGKNGFIHFNTGSYLVASDVTVPENVILSFEGGAVINVADNATLTVLSDKLCAPVSQIFGGGGAVALPCVKVGFIQWFGGFVNDGNDDAPALQKAMAALENIYLPAGVYNLQSASTVPQGKKISITGAGQYTLSQITVETEVGISYLRDEAKEPTELAINGIYFFGESKSTCAVRFYGTENKHDSRLTMDNFIFSSLGKLADVAFADGCEFANSRGVMTDRVFTLKNCNDTVFGSFLSLSGGQFIKAENCVGIKSENSCSVWASTTDCHFKDCNDVKIYQGGFDLGCGGSTTSGLIFENCDGVIFEGNWVASNNAAPGNSTTNPAPERNGISIIASKNVTVEGNSIVNSKNGVFIQGGGIKDANIRIVGNKGEGNLVHDFYITDTDGAELSYNFCMSYRWRKIPQEIAGENNGRLTVVGNSLGTDDYGLAKALDADGGSVIENNLFKVS